MVYISGQKAYCIFGSAFGWANFMRLARAYFTEEKSSYFSLCCLSRPSLAMGPLIQSPANTAAWLIYKHFASDI